VFKNFNLKNIIKVIKFLFIVIFSILFYFIILGYREGFIKYHITYFYLTVALIVLTVIYNLIKNTRVTKILLLLTTVAAIVSYLLYTQVPYIDLFIRKNFPEFSNFNADLSLYFSDLLTRLNNFYRSTLGFLNSTYQSIINTLTSFINILYNIKNCITNVFNQARTNNNLPRDVSLLISFRDTALINLK
jgi:hypothetical protein